MDVLSRLMRFCIGICLFAAGNQLAQAAKEAVVYGPEFPPYSNQQQKDFGVINALLEQTLSVTGYRLRFNVFPKLRVLHQLAHSDGAVGLVVDIGEKADQNYVFSDSILPLSVASFSIKGRSISVSDSVAGFVRGSLKPKDGNYPGVRFVEAGSTFQLLKMLESGRVDYALVEKLTASDTIITKIPNLIGRISIENVSNTQMHFRLAAHRDDPYAVQLVEDFNDALKSLRQSASFTSILARYGLLADCAVDQQPEGSKLLRIATVSNTDMLRMEKLSAIYEAENPGVRLEWHVMDESDLHRRMLSNVILDNCQYDIITAGSYQIPIWAKQGWLKSIDQLPESYARDDLIDNVAEAVSWNQQLYALPFYGEGVALFYRKDLLAKKGLTMPARPTLAEIKQIAARIHNPDRDQFGICLRTKPDFLEGLAVFTSILHSYGGGWFDEQWRPTIGSRLWREAAEDYVELLTRWGPVPLSNMGFQDLLEAFSEGRCGMWMDATVAAGALYDPVTSRVAERVGVTRAPSGRGGMIAPWLWVWALAIPEDSNYPSQALDFITWSTSVNYIKEVQKRFGVLATPPGTRYSTYRNDEYLEAAPFASFVGEVIATSEDFRPGRLKLPYQGYQFVEIPAYTAIGNESAWNLYQTLMGSLSLDEAINRSQRFAEEVMTTRQ